MLRLTLNIWSFYSRILGRLLVIDNNVMRGTAYTGFNESGKVLTESAGSLMIKSIKIIGNHYFREIENTV